MFTMFISEIRQKARRLERLFILTAQQRTAKYMRQRDIPDWPPLVTDQILQEARASLRFNQPRNPVATTNFSDESERDEGGLTLATFKNFCLRSF